jgi:hypothetical protein
VLGRTEALPVLAPGTAAVFAHRLLRCIPSVIARASQVRPVRMQFQRPVLVSLPGRFSQAPLCDRGAAS